MFFKCRAFTRYELHGCTICQTVFNHKNETTPPTLIAQFGTRFFKFLEIYVNFQKGFELQNARLQ